MFDWLKKRKKQEVKSTTVAPVQKIVSDPFEQEWQAFIKDTTPCENPTIIERKVVADNYMVSKDHKKVVMYLEDSHNEMINDFIEKNYHVISEIFKQWGYTFMYAPKEVEAIAQYYGTQTPDIEWNASTILKMQGCQLDEPIGTVIVTIEGVERDGDHDCWVATMRGVQLDAENERELIEQIRGYWRILNREYQREKEEKCCIRYRMADEEDDQILFRVAEDGSEGCRRSTGDVSTEKDMITKYYGGPKSRKREVQNRKLDYKALIDKWFSETKEESDTTSSDFLEEESTLDILTEEDELLLCEIQERIAKLHHSGIRQLLIEQMVRMSVKPSPLQVTDDARLLLTDYNKEVAMLPIDKVVYIFYLRHPEGVAIKMLEEHKDELYDIYSRILNKELTSKQRASIERLCNPLDNSINEKLSRIRQAFRAVTHDSVANCYIIQGERGEQRNITLNEELIELGVWGK